MPEKKAIRVRLTKNEETLLRIIDNLADTNLSQLNALTKTSTGVLSNQIKSISKKFPNIIKIEEEKIIASDDLKEKIAEIKDKKDKKILEIIKENKSITFPKLAELTKYKKEDLLKRINKISENSSLIKRESKKILATEPLKPIVNDIRSREGNKIIYRGLYMGEMGFGTHLYDPKIMRGLKVWKDRNNYNDLTAVIIQGGLLPRIPIYRTDLSKFYMHQIGIDPEKKTPEEDRIVVKEQLEGDKYEINFFKKYIDKKITNLLQASNFTKREIKEFIDSLNCEILYQLGVYDRQNISDIQKMEFEELKDKGKTLMGLEKKRFKDEKKLGDLEDGLEQIKNEKRFLTEVYKELKKEGEVKFSENKAKILGKNKDKIPQGILESLVTIRSLFLLKEKLYNHEKGLSAKIKDYKNAIKDQKTELKDTEGKIKLQEGDIKYSTLSKVLSRYETTPDVNEFVYIKSKSKYYGGIKRIFGDKIKDVGIYSSRMKTIKITNKAPKDSDRKDEIFEVDCDCDLYKKNGINIMLVHKMNFRSNNAPIRDDSLKRQKLELMFLNELSNSGYETFSGDKIIPDIIISVWPMVAGGFRAVLEMKNLENIVLGEERETPKICSMLKIPALHSLEKLEEGRRKNILTWDEKAFDNQMVASGVVFHTIYKDGEISLEYVDSSGLIQVSKWEDEINIYKKAITETKDKETKLKFEKIIQDIERKIRITERAKTYKIEISGDREFGSSNKEGRPSNLDSHEAGLRYQLLNGLPDLIVSSENMHGSIPSIGYRLENLYKAKIPKKQEEDIEKILENSRLNDKQKLAYLKKEFHDFIAGIPLPNRDDIAQETKRRVIPYFLQVLKKGGKIAYPSGNHASNNRTADEATIIANMLPTEYIDNKQFIPLKCEGHDTGLGAFRLDHNKKVIFSAHKMWKKRGYDNTIGGMEQIQNAGVPCDIVVRFHNHHPECGFANGRFYIESPGMMPYNNYVSHVGMTSSPRGLINYYTETEPSKLNYYHRCDFILDPTLELEKYMKGRYKFIIPMI